MLLGLFLVVAGILFVLIGRERMRKDLPEEEYLPMLAFAVWWFSVGALLFFTGAAEIVSATWRPDLALHVTETHVNIVLACLALYSLTYYFAFLYIGPNRLWIPLMVFYAASAIGLIHLINLQRPIGLEQGVRLEIVYAKEVAVSGVIRSLALLLVVPPLVGLTGYLALYRRAPTSIQKFRVANTAALILLLFASIIAVRILDLATIESLRPLLRAAGILLAAALLLSYRPALAVRRRPATAT